MKQAIVLCSGGLDSATTAHYVKKRPAYKKIMILFFNYGQLALLNERKCAKNCAKELGAKFVEIKLPELAKLSRSFINLGGKIKKLRMIDLKNTMKENKKWYVPFRNTIFLSYALALAESYYLGSKVKSDIFVGFKCEGKEPYPDTTKNYLAEINRLSKIASHGFRILAPLIDKDKEDIILLGKYLGIDFRKTYSCYLNRNKHCGYCIACRLRQAGFYWANTADPTQYKNTEN